MDRPDWPRAIPARLEAGLLVVAAAAVILVALGVAYSGPGFSPAGTLEAIAAQLPATLPAAILVSAAALADIAAGAIVLGLLRRAPFQSWSDLVLGGFAGAILLDCLLVFVLGGLGLFQQGTVGLILGLVLLLGLARRPIVGRPIPGIGPGGPGRPLALNLARWLLLGVVWAGPLVLTIASPVVPAGDVLPNHVAPAEHLRVFGQIASLATYPSPIYGPSRLFLGYSALMAVLATLTNLPAGLTVAAFSGALIGLSIVGVRRIASAAFGAEAGFWALVAYGLTSTFVRLPDVRDSVVALPLAALALALLSDRVDRWTERASLRQPDWLLAAAISGAILVHPLVGALAGVTVGILTLADPARHARRTIPALAASLVAVLPQLAVMIGLEPAPVFGVAAFAAAIVVGLVVARLVDRPDWAALSAPAAATGTVGLGAAAVGLVLVGDPAAIEQALGFLNLAFPVLFGAAGLALGLAVIGLVPSARGGRRMTLAALGAGVGALIGAALVPDTSLLGQSLRYEIPKAVGYWLAWSCVPITGGLIALIARARVPALGRLALIATFLAVVLIPIGAIRADSSQASQSVAAVLGHHLQAAEAGYWQGYPDVRLVVDSTGDEVLEFLRTEIAAGRITAETQLLHVAASYQESASLPIGVFTGIEETMVSADATTTIFTAGGRIYPLGDLPAELGAGFAYVVLEPAGLPSDVRAAVAAAGYRSVFVNSTAEVFTASR
jgi:hypothetical protein